MHGNGVSVTVGGISSLAARFEASRVTVQGQRIIDCATGAPELTIKLTYNFYILLYIQESVQKHIRGTKFFQLAPFVEGSENL